MDYLLFKDGAFVSSSDHTYFALQAGLAREYKFRCYGRRKATNVLERNSNEVTLIVLGKSYTLSSSLLATFTWSQYPFSNRNIGNKPVALGHVKHLQ